MTNWRSYWNFLLHAYVDQLLLVHDVHVLDVPLLLVHEPYEFPLDVLVHDALLPLLLLQERKLQRLLRSARKESVEFPILEPWAACCLAASLELELPE